MRKILSTIALSAIVMSSNAWAMGETEDGKVKFTANQDVWGGKWIHFKGKFHQQFGKLIHDDAKIALGNREVIEGLMIENYGWTNVKAKEALDEFVRAHHQDDNQDNTAALHHDTESSHTSVQPSKVR